MKNDLGKTAIKGKIPRRTGRPRFVLICQCSSWARWLLAGILTTESLGGFIFLCRDCSQHWEDF